MKTIEQYTYNTFDGIGKGYSSQVYKGRNEKTSKFIFYKIRRISRNKINRPQIHKRLSPQKTPPKLNLSIEATS